MSDEQVEEKFRGLAGEVLPRDQVERATDFLWNLEKAADASELVRLMVPPKS